MYYDEITEDLFLKLMDAIDKNCMMDFMSTDGYLFTNNQLITIIKELDYSVFLEHENCENRGYDVNKFKDALVEAFDM